MSASQIAQKMSLFEIDEALDLLIESAAEQAAEGEISDDRRTALSEYVDAFGEKVDRIANYIKAQEAFAESAKRAANRLEARRKAADSRVRACKGFLCWFMTCRSLKHLRGRLNTVTLASNSVDSVVLDESVPCDPVFQTVTVTLPWPEWRDLLSVLPICTVRSRLEAGEQAGKAIDRTRIADALRSGQVIPGARLVRGKHVRLS